MSGKYPGGIVTAGAPAGYSVYFDDASSELTIANNANLIPTTQNFWIEAFIYITVPSTTNSVFSKYTSASVNFTLYVTSSNFLAFDYNGSTSTSSGALSANTWYHVAVVRSGTSTNQSALFVNGTRVLQFTMASDFSSVTSTARIGRYQTGGAYFGGYISNLRYGIGTTAPYNAITDATINVPTQLFPVANTQLLTCQSPTIIDNSINAFTITTVGTPVTSTFTPFTGYSATPPNPNTQSNTSGVWSVSEAEYWMGQNKWPMPYPRQSLRFNSADSANLTRTPASASNRKTWTWSGWIKRSVTGNVYKMMFSAGSNATECSIRFTDPADAIHVYQYSGGGFNYQLATTAVYRDTSAWYHIVVATDTTQATSSDRVKLYVNGTQATSFSTASYPTLNYDTFVNSTVTHTVGNVQSGSQYFDGYMADINFVDGLALTPSSFGQTDANTGAWIPQNYTGSYGTNGFRLTFQNNTGTTATTLGKDWSGVGNNWTPNNFSVAAGTGNDSLTDSPWNFGVDNGLGGEVRGNYCTWNPLVVSPQTNATLANGNLQATSAVSVNYTGNLSTFAYNSGKVYVEMFITGTGSAIGLGIINSESLAGVVPANYGYAQVSDAWLRLDLGYIDNNASHSVSGLPTLVANDTMIMAVDFDNGKLWFGKNGVWDSGNPSSGTSPSVTFTVGSKYFYICWQSYQGGACYTNFGQRTYSFVAPSGFKALCTTNLPTPAIGATSTTLASKNMNIVLYTGNGTSQAVTGYGFQPDWVWFKARTGTARNHILFDAVRGANQGISTSSTSAESTWSGQSFLSDGFTVDATFSSEDNASTISFVGWAWKGNGSGVANTSGSISSTVSANQPAGFSIVTYTSQSSGNGTIGHGLNIAPAMIIIKPRTGTVAWTVYHQSLGNNAYIILNTTAAQVTPASTAWATTSPTTSVFTQGSAFAGLGTMVAYCFAEIAGYSKFGSYTGNGSTDGPFVYCGFRPRYILFKQTNAVNDWVVIDTARNTYNAANSTLYPDLAIAEESPASGVTGVDILSNGFKIRDAKSFWNTSSGTYIFAAFAETPFNYSRAR